MTQKKLLAGKVTFIFAGFMMVLNLFASLSTGTVAPDFSLPAIESEEQITLRDFKDKKIVIVHFWKSRWRECRAEFPHLKKVAEVYPDSLVQILSVNPINRKGKVEADAKKYKLGYPVLIGRDSDIIKDYKIKALPKVILIDKQGKIILSEKFIPFEKIQEVLKPLLQKLEEEDKKSLPWGNKCIIFIPNRENLHKGF